MTIDNREILQQCSILIVDDNAALRKDLKELLSLYVDDIYEAADGVEAYTVFKEKQPTILFSDIKMPNENGIDLVKKIRKENDTIPIVLISAHSDKALLFEALRLNLVDYLVKPIFLKDLKDLFEKLAISIEKKSLLKVKLSETLFFHQKEKVLYNSGVKITLTNKEEKFLCLLIQRENEVLREDFIVDYVWEHELKTISALRNLVSRLRRKIGKNYIQSIHGQGYKFIRQL